MEIIKERFKLTPSVYLVLMKKNQVLLSRRSNTGYFDGYYSFPAGHIDGNETLKQGMIREAKEEINIELDLSDLNLVYVMNRKILGDERIDFFFIAKKWRGDLKNMEIDKCDDLRWFDLGDLPENIIPYIKQSIDSITKKNFYNELEEDKM